MVDLVDGEHVAVKFLPRGHKVCIVGPCSGPGTPTSMATTSRDALQSTVYTDRSIVVT